jgi:hypothetical protein
VAVDGVRRGVGEVVSDLVAQACTLLPGCVYICIQMYIYIYKNIYICMYIHVYYIYVDIGRERERERGTIERKRARASNTALKKEFSSRH